MKIKLDENLPHALVKLLNTLGHEVDSVPQEGLTGQPDDIIWQTTQQEKRFLITQDLDFSDINKFAPCSHFGLLLVRLRNPDGWH
jgi:predicted nuclease of predicted toxin-antitoxin system